MRSPQITGVPPLHEGSSAFQTMFCARLHSVETPVESLMPLPLGPRHAGQFSPAKATADRTNNTSTEELTRDMSKSLGESGSHLAEWWGAPAVPHDVTMRGSMAG